MGTAKPRPPRRRELWYDVAGYEGQYQVSDFGRVLALARIDAGGHQRSARVHRPHGGASGRLFVSLCKEGVSTCHCVSALLARAYGIPNPRNDRYVIHLNGDYGTFDARISRGQHWPSNASTTATRSTAATMASPVTAIGGVFCAGLPRFAGTTGATLWVTSGRRKRRRLLMTVKSSGFASIDL